MSHNSQRDRSSSGNYTTASIELFDGGLLRCAAWPIETISEFASPKLSSLALELNCLSESIRTRQSEIASALYVAIPQTRSSRLRGALFHIKREARRNLNPYDSELAFPGALQVLDPDLRRLLQHDNQEREKLALLRGEFAQAYEYELNRERSRLRVLTSDNHFRKALILANPELAKRWQKELLKTPLESVSGELQRAKSKLIKTEGTILFYLLRAATRPTPGGIWAGVARILIDKNGDNPANLRVVSGQRRVAATVNLAPFATVVNHLSRSPRYLLGQSIDALLGAGVLLSDLTFPLAATNCWEALSVIGDQLLKSDRMFWFSKVSAVRSLCEELSVRLDHMSAEELDATVASIEDQVKELYLFAGLDEPIPRPAVFVDLQLVPAAIVSVEFWNRVRESVREVLSFYETHGVAERLRAGTVEALLGNASRGISRSFLDVVRHDGPSVRIPSQPDISGGGGEATSKLKDEILELQRFWYERLMTESDDSSRDSMLANMCSCEPRAGFDGTIIFSFSPTQGLRAEWGRPHAFCLASRFSDFLNGGPENSSLVSEVRDWYESWRSRGFEAIEIAGGDPLNENVATRPRLTAERVLADESETKLSDLLIVSAPGVVRPWLRHATSNKKMIPVYNCTAVIGTVDPCSQTLYRVALSHGWEFVCRRLFPNSDGVRHIPRLMLPAGTVISPRRWFLTLDQVQALLDLSEPDRYVQWIKEKQSLGMPNAVLVVTEPGPNKPLLYLPTTSPLALRSLFSKISARPRRLEFIETHEKSDQWLMNAEDGTHHASEIMVAWRDPQYWRTVFDESDG